ncbi:hypothetical protein BH09VER1_BH09VER1_48750 [soil metagenome]
MKFGGVLKWVALVALGLATRGWGQEVIPLELGWQGDVQRLFIYVGIDGGPVNKYLFDTGSAGFNAAYYDGAYTGPDPNPALWTNTGTLAASGTVTYGSATSGFSYQLNEVTVNSIQIYNPTDLLGPAAIVLTGNYQMGQVVNKYDHTGAVVTSFQSNLSQGLAPENGIYGTFGAALYTGLNATGSQAFVNSSILGQATTSGWAVVANDSGSAYAILGLDEGIRSQFTSTMAWTGSGGPAFPGSGANASTEFGGGDMTYVLSGSGQTPVVWTAKTLLDTGTQDNTLNAKDADLTGYMNGTRVKEGYDLAITGTDAGAGTYDFTTTGDKPDPPTYDVTLGTATDTSTVGIGFYLNNSVAFDLANQQTLYTDATVTVPEPGTVALMGLGCLAVGAGLRRRGSRGLDGAGA